MTRALVPVSVPTVVEKPSINRALLSLCLCGPALGVAAWLLMQHPACSSGGAAVATVDTDAPSTKTEVIATVDASPKDAVQGPPAPAPKSAKKLLTATPKNVDVTGSVNQTTKNNQGQYAQAKSKTLDRSNHVAPAHKPRRYGWRGYPYPWPPAPYPYAFPPTAFEMDVYPGW